jgi:hypothetical protein
MAKSNKTVDRIQAVWNKLGGEDGVDRLLRGEVTIVQAPPKWREEQGVVYFSVTSDGTSGEDWITRLQDQGFVVKGEAKRLLRSSAFQPTNGITTRVAVLKGELFGPTNAHSVLHEGRKRNLFRLNAETACLIREKFTDDELKKMGLQKIICMHDPKRSAGRYLGVENQGLEGFFDYDDSPRPGVWLEHYNFAFGFHQEI